MKFDFNNFHDATVAEFKRCPRPDRAPDYASVKSDGTEGSTYWDTGEGVIRPSDHWGAAIRSCHWFKRSSRLAKSCRTGRRYTGYCAYADFEGADASAILARRRAAAKKIQLIEQRELVRRHCTPGCYGDWCERNGVSP